MLFTKIWRLVVDFCSLGSKVVLPFKSKVHKASVQSSLLRGSVHRDNLTVRHIEWMAVLQREEKKRLARQEITVSMYTHAQKHLNVKVNPLNEKTVYVCNFRTHNA